MMTDHPLLSIIIPVFNVEQYISVCLDSILSQPFHDYEILLIDDGSTDSSGSICDDYALKHPQIKVFHKKNEGVSRSRNMGIEKATGKWIYFVDSDDELTPRCLETLHSKMNDDFDIIEGRYIPVTDDRPDTYPLFFGKDTSYSKQDYLYRLYRYIPKQYHGYLWNKIFRRDIINKYDIRFQTDIYFKEDGLFILEYTCKMTRKVLYMQDLVYIYYKRSSGMMKTYLKNVSERSLTHLVAVNRMYDILQSQHPSFRTKLGAKDEISRSYRMLYKRTDSTEIKQRLDSLLSVHVSRPYYHWFVLKRRIQRMAGKLLGKNNN